ncbi:hypothetical protein AYI69_g3578, partial [Smittium culicis]
MRMGTLLAVQHLSNMKIVDQK